MFIRTLLSDPILFIRIVLIVILSISLHELAHGWVALSQGDDTPRKAGHLTLNPLVHLGWESMIFLCVAGVAWGQMPVNPSKFRHRKLSNIMVSAAGPLLNLALGIFFLVLMKLVDIYELTEILSFNFLYLASHINITLFLFNLLPIPPLDGFHIYSEIFPALKPLENTQFGLFALVLLFLIPEFGEGLSAIADLIINIGVG